MGIGFALSICNTKAKLSIKARYKQQIIGGTNDNRF
jgi:hypothetical protein